MLMVEEDIIYLTILYQKGVTERVMESEMVQKTEI